MDVSKNGCKTSDYAAIGMALVAPKGRFLNVNPFLSRIVGYSEQELLATTFQRITHPDDLQHNLECVQRLLAGSVRFYELERRYLHKAASDWREVPPRSFRSLWRTLDPF